MSTPLLRPQKTRRFSVADIFPPSFSGCMPLPGPSVFPPRNPDGESLRAGRFHSDWISVHSPPPRREGPPSRIRTHHSRSA